MGNGEGDQKADWSPKEELPPAERAAALLGEPERRWADRAGYCRETVKGILI